MNKIKYLRSTKELSIRQLAKVSGVGISTIQRLEQDGKAYSTTLAKLAKVFEVPLEELLEFELVSPKESRQKAPSPLAA